MRKRGGFENLCYVGMKRKMEQNQQLHTQGGDYKRETGRGVMR